MSRTLTISNGNLLVGIDSRGQVRDFYFPFVGHSNHVSGGSGNYTHRIGVWVEGVLRWLDDPTWDVQTHTAEHGSTTEWILHNEELGVTLTMYEIVHNEHNVFLRKLTLTNNRDTRRTCKVFFGQEFRISESRRGDTALYDPRVSSIIHYKGNDVFLIHARVGDKPFPDYSVGLFGIENKEGTYLDAADGLLSKNPIEHGSVDSVIGVDATIDAHGSFSTYYWVIAAHTISEAHELQKLVLKETPERLMESTIDYWKAWMQKEPRQFTGIELRLQTLYERSLYIIRAHADNRGGIIASSDSDMLNQGRDHYSYVWPRDAAICAHALGSAGYFDTTERFYTFITKLHERDGYLMHKYRVDGVLGSSWHPWMRNGVPELPIQEDETALPIFLLAEHYTRAKNLEFIESLYNPFIEPATDFLASYIDDETGLPASSYDLWEEKFGSSTFTASAVYGALHAGAELSALLGKRMQAEKYRKRAESIKQAILGILYNAEEKIFSKLVRSEKGKIVRDNTLDMSSLHGLVYFNVLDPRDVRITEMVTRIENRLQNSTHAMGGFVRYEGDEYYKIRESNVANPWCVTTLWMAQYYIRVARTRSELLKAYSLLEWVHARATESGILPEQINPDTGAHLSTSPLIWSHAEFVLTTDAYVQKYRVLTM